MSYGGDDGRFVDNGNGTRIYLALRQTKTSTVISHLMLLSLTKMVLLPQPLRGIDVYCCRMTVLKHPAFKLEDR
ncbi:hypothetical protein OH492_17690 [Vibrio chagasii]|nr:hypothetical protein [Vibrio chagasii]